MVDPPTDGVVADTEQLGNLCNPELRHISEDSTATADLDKRWFALQSCPDDRPGLLALYLAPS
jgi:hypothetical protein